MKLIWLIAQDEWRNWRRSSLAQAVFALVMLLALAATILTALDIYQGKQAQAARQTEAEQTFRSKPDRHPHRMVHYGHYVFREAPPLAMVDPGVEEHTGSIMFLEGHRHNTAMFAKQGDRGSLAPFGQLTPALVLQVMVPLMLILLGAASVTRERETGTLVQLNCLGVPPSTLLLGKTLALVIAALLILLPLMIACLAAVSLGESPVIALLFLSGYVIYLLIWCMAVTLASTLARQRLLSQGILLGLWLLTTIIIPKLATETSEIVIPTPSKIETELTMQEAMNAAGDSHNIRDRAFDDFRQKLLDQHGVDKIEDLPFNYRGAISTFGEARTTAVLNEYSELRMGRELSQARVERSFGWGSPMLALRVLSRTVADTSLESHHRFLREAEALRFDFVQGLNSVHENELPYSVDIKRGTDSASEQRARVSANNWKLLKDFAFAPADVSVRLVNALGPLIQLFLWLLVILGWSMWKESRLLLAKGDLK